MRATLFLRLIALSFSPPFSSSAFSQAHVHPATHTQTREEDTRKRSHTTVRSSSLSLSFFHQPIVLKNRARRFAYNNVHCIFEQWEDPPSSSPFPPSLPPYRCLFQRQDQASRALINGGKRSSSFDPWSSVLFPPMDPAFDYSIFSFFFFPRYTIHRHCLLFVNQQEPIHFNVNSRQFLFFSFLPERCFISLDCVFTRLSMHNTRFPFFVSLIKWPGHPLISRSW